MLGLDPQSDTTPGSQVEIWTQWGWIADHLAENSLGSVLIKQNDLIQQLADLAANTNDLTVIQASSIEDVVTYGNKVTGLHIEQAENTDSMRILGHLTIATGGTVARVAELCKLRKIAQTSQGVRYHARYSLTSLPKVQLWLLNPGIVSAIPRDDGETEIICTPAPAHLAAFEHDPEGNFAHLVSTLPHSGRLKSAQRTSSITPVSAPESSWSESIPGLVLMSNAKMTSNPLWGQNWALPAARQLVNDTVYPLKVSGEIEAGLRLYRRWHQQQTHEDRHEFAALATGRPLNRREKILLTGALRDDKLAHHVQAYITGLTGSLFTPDVLARATWASMTYRQPDSIPVTQS